MFTQSLFFKYTGSPEAVCIFQGKFDPRVASLGFQGVFAPAPADPSRLTGLADARVVSGHAAMATSHHWLRFLACFKPLAIKERRHVLD